jgi:hypothetical protein
VSAPVIGFMGFGEAAFWLAHTLAELGIDPIMATATARRIQTCAALDLKAQFNGREPADYRDVVRAMGGGTAR